MNKLPWRWIGLGVLIISLIIAWRLLPVTAWLKSFNEWVVGLGPLGVVIFMAAYVLATVLFVPGSVLTIGAGFIFGLGMGVVVVSISATIGAALAFLIARYIARKQVEAKVSGNEKLKAIDRAIGEQGWKLIFLLRLSPAIPFNFSNYFYGLTAVKFWPYVLASWIGMLPGTVLYVYLGTVGKVSVQAASGGAERSPWEWAFLVIGLIATLIVTIWVTRIARKALQKTDLPAGSS